MNRRRPTSSGSVRPTCLWQTCLRQPRLARGGVGRSAAFTLNEMLVVVAIVVLMVALAVPAFNVISGSRSVESAENTASSYLSIVRSQAIGVQEARGVLFFEEPDTQRVTLIPVFSPVVKLPPNANYHVIDLLGGQKEMTLPKGIGLQMVDNATTATAGSTPEYPWPLAGVIMFDGAGRLSMDRVLIAGKSLLANRVQNVVLKQSSLSGTTMLIPDVNAGTSPFLPHIGFIVYDQATYAALGDDTSRQNWLPDNATPFLINRYNGTLLRAQ